MSESGENTIVESPGAVLAADEQEIEQPQEVKVVDKRRFARLLGFGGVDDAAEASDVDSSESRLPSYVDELKRRVEAAESNSRAEVEAARARLERHYESKFVTARAETAASLLEVLDNLDRALSVDGAEESPLYEGLVATRDLFVRKLVEMGVEQVPGVGEPFDPEDHQAIDEVDVDDRRLDGKVVEVMQRGFRTAERLVRPAFVRVGRWTGSAEAVADVVH